MSKFSESVDRGDNSIYFDFHDDELEFMKAIERYRKDNKKRFLSWSEVLEVLKELGYTKVGTDSTPIFLNKE